LFNVMAGLDPAIHGFLVCCARCRSTAAPEKGKEPVDARIKSGHDERKHLSARATAAAGVGGGDIRRKTGAGAAAS